MLGEQGLGWVLCLLGIVSSVLAFSDLTTADGIFLIPKMIDLLDL